MPRYGCLLEQLSGRMDLSVTLWRIYLLLCGSVCYYSGFRTCGLALSSTRTISPIWLGALQRLGGGGCRRRAKASGCQRPVQGVVEEKVQGCRGDKATHHSYALQQLPQLPPTSPPLCACPPQWPALPRPSSTFPHLPPTFHPMFRSPSVARLAEAVAHEVTRQINNRHSLNTAFLPADLVKLLQAYAELHPLQGEAGICKVHLAI